MAINYHISGNRLFKIGLINYGLKLEYNTSPGHLIDLSKKDYFISTRLGQGFLFITKFEKYNDRCGLDTNRSISNMLFYDKYITDGISITKTHGHCSHCYDIVNICFANIGDYELLCLECVSKVSGDANHYTNARLEHNTYTTTDTGVNNYELYMEPYALENIRNKCGYISDNPNKYYILNVMKHIYQKNWILRSDIHFKPYKSDECIFCYDDQVNVNKKRTCEECHTALLKCFVYDNYKHSLLCSEIGRLYMIPDIGIVINRFYTNTILNRV
jgi:hypothetical protein